MASSPASGLGDGCAAGLLWEGLVHLSFVLQMKMPSKKFAHIPVYTLGFESSQRASTAKASPTQRRDVFQCVPLLCGLCGCGGQVFTLMWALGR